MEHLCRLTGTKHLSATACDHQTASQAERVIHDIKQMLTKTLHGEYNQWNQHIASIRFAHNIIQ